MMRARRLSRTFKKNQAFVSQIGYQENNWVTENHNKKEPQKGKSAFSKIWREFKEYCDHSNLHGLRYVGDSNLTFGERFFWLTAFCLSLICASYFIATIFQKWNNSPVLISFSPFDVDFDVIPFPAITICNMNQVQRDEAERIIKNGTPIEKSLLDTYCNSTSYSSNHGYEKAATWGEIEKFLKSSSQPCHDMIKSCLWEGDAINCDHFFMQQLTDEGVCCTFNLLPPQQLFRDESCISCPDNTDNITLHTHSDAKIVYDWTAERDFPDPNTGNLDVIPLRPVGAGTHLGLSVVLDVEKNNYFCSSTSSVGFKMIFTNPTEIPSVENFGFLASPGLEYRFLITPEIRSCIETVREVDLEKRQCYFQDERPLYYYRAYTQSNCNLECVSNYTYKLCKCVPYYLPRTREMHVCGKKEENCSLQAREDMQLVYGNGSSCSCLPSCYRLRFIESGSSSQLYTLHSKYGLSNITRDYFLENMAVVTFFFNDVRYRKTYKSLTYGIIDALSSIGGLLGLCLGFSFMSVIEIVYFVFLRAICVYANPKRNKKGKIPFYN